jgi:hypothetical protein
LGLSITDPVATPTRYPGGVVAETILKNGNREIEFADKVDCHTFFEVDNTSQLIVNVRFEGTKQACVRFP